MVTSGNVRYRFPVSLARALTTAGEITGTGGSPTPVGASVLGTSGHRRSPAHRRCKMAWRLFLVMLQQTRSIQTVIPRTIRHRTTHSRGFAFRDFDG